MATKFLKAVKIPQFLIRGIGLLKRKKPGRPRKHPEVSIMARKSQTTTAAVECTDESHMERMKSAIHDEVSIPARSDSSVSMCEAVQEVMGREAIPLSQSSTKRKRDESDSLLQPPAKKKYKKLDNNSHISMLHPNICAEKRDRESDAEFPPAKRAAVEMEAEDCDYRSRRQQFFKRIQGCPLSVMRSSTGTDLPNTHLANLFYFINQPFSTKSAHVDDSIQQFRLRSLRKVSEEEGVAQDFVYRTKVYFNACCKPSLLFDPSKIVSKLPFSIGPGHRVDVTLQAVLRMLLDLCSDPASALDCLPSAGNGMIIIVSTATGEIKSKVFPRPTSLSEYWTLLLKYSEALGCCKNFISSRKPTIPCLLCHPIEVEKEDFETKCSEVIPDVEDEARNQRSDDLGSETQNVITVGIESRAPAVSVDVGSGAEICANVTFEDLALGPSFCSVCMPVEVEVTTEEEVEDCKVVPSTPQECIEMPIVVGNVEVEVESAVDTESLLVTPSSTFSSSSDSLFRKLDHHPQGWSIEDVCSYINGINSDSVKVFRNHEIDGDKLMHLNPDMMVNCMNIKMGRALRIFKHILELKRSYNIS